MELGGVSVPGRGSHNDGAFLLKDLSAFETKLGGLEAFVMVSDGTGGGQGDLAAAHLAVKAADTYLESILIGIASGKSPEVDPALALKTIVSQASASIAKAAAAGGASMSATFVGAFVSADRVWFGQVGEGRVYLLGEGEVRQLVVDRPVGEHVSPESIPDEGEVVADLAQSGVTESSLGGERADIDVGRVDLNPGDALVLCGKGPAGSLGASEILDIPAAARDAQSAASSLAVAAATADADESSTVVIFSDDWSLFAPSPPPQAPADDSSAVIYAANADVPRGFRAEKIFLIAMSVILGIEVLALLGMAIIPRVMSSARTAPPSSSGTGTASEPTAQSAVVATATPVATASVEPTMVVQAEFPKTLTVPKNVKGGLWLRKKATTLGGSNLVVQLKGGTKVEAVDIQEAADAQGGMHEFYVFKVSDIDSDQVLETNSYPWPPAKSVKKVYAFAASFEESR